MWECDYAREPINYRLFFLKLLKKIWILPLASIIGAIVIGGIYYFVNMVVGDGYQYRARTVYYVQYAKDTNGLELDYYNYFTWEELAKTEYFVDGIVAAMNGKIDKEYVLTNTTATIDSDYRYLYTRSVSGDKQQSIDMEHAFSDLIVGLPEMRSEIESIEVIDSADLSDIEDISLIFISHAVIVGAVVGLLVAIVGMIFYECVDTSVFIPATLEKRYHIPALGAPSMKELDENCYHILGEKETALIVVDDLKTSAAENLVKVFPAECKISTYENPTVEPETVRDVRSKECVVLAVKAGAHNGKSVERVIEQLGRQDVKVNAFLLYNEDEWLINRYYR